MRKQGVQLMARVAASVSLRFSGFPDKVELLNYLNFGRSMGLWGFGVAMCFCFWVGRRLHLPCTLCFDFGENTNFVVRNATNR